MTDRDGRYVFENPGGRLLCLVKGSDGLVFQETRTGIASDVRFPSGNILRIVRHHVTAGRAADAGNLVVRDTLTLSEPTNAAIVTSAVPQLKWNALADAVRLILERQQTRETTLLVTRPLANCNYLWWVEAYNAKSEKIPESWNYYTTAAQGPTSGFFVVKADDKPCR